MRLLIGTLFATTLLSTGCQNLRVVTADQWDQVGRSQYYLGYLEGTCFNGACFNQKGKMVMCSLRDDNSLDCSEQTSVAEALKAKD